MGQSKNTLKPPDIVFLLLRILTGKKRRQIKLQRLGKYEYGPCAVGTLRQLFTRGS